VQLAVNPKQGKSLPGLILSRQWIESDRGLELIYWFATEQGPFRLRVPGQEAVCFYPTEQHSELCAQLRRLLRPRQWRTNATQLKNFAQQDVSALYLSSQRNLFDCREKLIASGIDLVETDIRPTDRFLMERFITGAANIEGEFTTDDGFTDIHAAHLSPAEFRPVLRAISIDIETDYEASELYSIALYSDVEHLVLMRSDNPSLQLEPDAELDLHLYSNERELLLAFIAAVQRIDPDLFMGWNVVNFDFRCVQLFCDRLDISLDLGRNNEQVVDDDWS